MPGTPSQEIRNRPEPGPTRKSNHHRDNRGGFRRTSKGSESTGLVICLTALLQRGYLDKMIRRQKQFSFVAILVATISLASCTAYNKFDIRNALVDPPPGKASASVVGVDERQQLKKGKIKPEYLGLTRNLFGFPYLVKTATKRPLALEVAEAVTGSLRSTGRQTTTAKSAPDSTSAMSEFRIACTQRLILIHIKRWESDTLWGTDLDYSVSLDVWDKNGQVLASSSKKDYADLGGSATPAMHARESVMRELGSILTDLLNEPQIQKALQ